MTTGPLFQANLVNAVIVTLLEDSTAHVTHSLDSAPAGHHILAGTAPSVSRTRTD